LQQFADAGAKIAELEKQEEALIAEIDELKKEFEETDANLKAAEELEKQIKESIEHPNLDALLKIRTDAEVLRDKLKQTEASTNPHLEAFEALLTESVKETNTKKLDELKTLLEHQQFMLKLLTDKNSFLRRSIINETIPFLNDRLNYYTSELGLPHLVNFADDMSCTVSEYGRELDFGNLSNGEKKRVNIAMSLAFRDVLHHLHGRANCMFIDELDGGALDLPGVDSIIRVLKKKSRDDNLAIWIISHRPEMGGRFDTEITVRKENGFSSIIYGTE
jgi:DNA repair exonuclease SbcCD ATPase subunit